MIDGELVAIETDEREAVDRSVGHLHSSCDDKQLSRFGVFSPLHPSLFHFGMTT